MYIQWDLPERMSNELLNQNNHYGVVDESPASYVVAHLKVYVSNWQFV